KVNAKANLVGSIGEPEANSSSLRQLQYDRASGNVLDREPHGFEDAHIGCLALTCRAGDDLAQRADAAPAQVALAFRQDQVAGFQSGGVDVIGDQQVGSRNGATVDLPAIWIVRAADIQML